MPRVKPKLKNSLLKLQREKKIRDKASQPYSKTKSSSYVKPASPPPYQPDDLILLIGEGNFSFARALAESVLRVGHLIVATTLDSEEIMNQKYEDARDHVSAFCKYGGKVLYEVDGTQHSNTFSIIRSAGSTGIKDQDRNILANQKLIKSFLNSAIPFLTSRALYSDLKDGEIHITTKTGLPYDDWNIKKIIKSTGALAVRETLPFNIGQYPGYEHRRTLGFKDGVSKSGNEEILSKKPKTIVIVRKEVLELEEEQRRLKKKEEDD